MIEREPGTDWHDLQGRVAAILDECGLVAEVAKTIRLTRGQSEIDVYAVDPTSTPPTVYFCECKRWSTRVPQAEVQTFRTVVADGGAHVGLFISSAGFQAGAHEVVRNTNLHLLPWAEFQEMFVDRWCERYGVPSFRDHGARLATATEPIMSDAWLRETNGQPLEPAEAVGMMANDMWGGPFGTFDPTRRRQGDHLAPAIWSRRDHYARHLPIPIREAQSLRVLLDELVAFCNNWTRERDATRQR